MKTNKSPYISNPDILYCHNTLQTADVVLDFEGADMLPAGTLISCEGKAVNDATALGVLQFDTWKGFGSGKGVVIISGHVDLAKAQECSGVTYSAAAKAAMKNIVFAGDNLVGGPTHYDTRTVNEFRYEWDGNLDGEDTVTINGSQYVKVSAEVPPVGLDEEKYKERIAYLYSTDSHELIDSAPMNGYAFYEAIAGKFIIIETEFVLGYIALEDVEYNSVHLTKGVYLAGDKWGLYVGKLHISVETGELKQLDMKFIPNALKEPYAFHAGVRFKDGVAEVFLTKGSYDEALQALKEGRRVQLLGTSGSSNGGKFLELSEHLDDCTDGFFKFIHFDTVEGEIEVYIVRVGTALLDPIERTFYEMAKI